MNQMLSVGLPTSINVGCGYDKRPGFLNVDMDPACAPDVLIVDNDFSVLPRGHFRYLVARDVLEHIPRSQSLAALLEWSDLLMMGGQAEVETSSILDALAQMIDKPYATQHGWTICLFGNQAHPGDYHFTGFTPTTLLTHLHAAGFQPGPITLREGWLISSVATKVEDWTALLSSDLDDEAFVDASYRAALRRDPDPGGRAGCLEWLSRGETRRTVLKSLFSSEERLFRAASWNGL